MSGCEQIQKMLSGRVRQAVFLQWRRNRAEVEGAGIEVAKGFLEVPAAYLPRQVAGRMVVKHRPKGNRFTEWASCYATKEKQCGVLGFDDERFESAGGDDSEIRVGHTF